MVEKIQQCRNYLYMMQQIREKYIQNDITVVYFYPVLEALIKALQYTLEKLPIEQNTELKDLADAPFDSYMVFDWIGKHSNNLDRVLSEYSEEAVKGIDALLLAVDYTQKYEGDNFANWGVYLLRKEPKDMWGNHEKWLRKH